MIGNSTCKGDSLALADLHIHTTVSDGSDSFAQVLKRAQGCGLSYVAFTNHDSLSGISLALSLQKNFAVKVIGGIEISAWDFAAGTKAHILGYGFVDDHAPAVDALCAPLLERRHAMTLWQIEQLKSHGYALDQALLAQYAQSSTCLYKQHVMAALIDAPYNSPAYSTLYSSLFKDGGICDDDITYVDACDAVLAIKQDGGIAILAHPGQFDNFAMVGRLVAVGLDGIEKYHHYHGPRERQIVDQLTDDYRLVRTGGSDYHGHFGKVLCPGACRIDMSEAKAFMNLLIGEDSRKTPAPELIA